MTQALARPTVKRSEPTWDVAKLFPPQGHWTENEYLALTDSTNKLVELIDGRIEVLPMPKSTHQRIAQFLEHLLFAFVSARELGEVLPAPLRVRLRPRTFREPDVVFMLTR